MVQTILSTKSSLLLLLAAIPGVLLNRDDFSTQPGQPVLSSSETQIYLPVLQPSESTPPIETYMLGNLIGEPCIKATFGVVYIVMDKKRSWYFNMDPTRVTISGFCNKDLAHLSLLLPHSSASLQLTFKNENKYFYLNKLEAHLSPRPICEKCENKTYAGLLVHQKLFIAADGQSFKCSSESFLTSSELKIKLVLLQMQAFNVTREDYGEEVECWADYNMRVTPIVIGAVVVGLFLIAVLTFLFIKDHRIQGYERL